MDHSYDGGCANISSVPNDPDDEESNALRLPAQNKGPYREQDIYLPIANIARIMKSAVPQNGKIAKDAKECVQECVSEFISFITSEASERCAQEKRKTINGEDVLFAMGTLGFDPYIAPLKIYLEKYRDTLKAEKNGGNFIESSDSTVLHDDVVDPFGPSQFSDLLVTTEQSSVFSNQHSVNLDQPHLQFS